jgi:hypothetical protein
MKWRARAARGRARESQRETLGLLLLSTALLAIVSAGSAGARDAPETGPAAESVTEAPHRHAPIALDDTASTEEGRVVDIHVLANDRSPQGLALSLVGVAQPEHGWVLINGDDTLRYQPHTGFTGVDDFAYTIADAVGAMASAAVRVVVSDVPDAPVAENQTLWTDEDVALAITLVGVDADGEPLRFEIDRPPVHGSLSGGLPDVLYTPQIDYHGADGFVFSVHDDQGGSDVGVVSIRIAPVADAPLAADDAASTDEGRVVDIRVLANDRDPDGDVLHLVDIAQPPNGWVLINGDDTLRYQPFTGFTGVDGFAYTVADADGATASATVSVVVRGAHQGGGIHE